MRKYQIFISSTYDDLRETRELVMKAVLELGHIPVGMELFSAADEEQWKLIARQIQESDYYVVIIAHRYGSTVDGVSFTEKEYDFAIEQKVPVLGFLIDDSAPWPGGRVETTAAERLKQFKEKVRAKLVAFWTSADDLAGKVAISLAKQFAKTPRPGWIRATDTVDPQVVNELSRLSEDNRRLREELERSKTRSQLELIKIQPHFEFELRECGEDDDNTDCLEIYNTGEFIKYFYIRQFSFLRVHADVGQTARYVATQFFYDRNFTGKGSGLLVTLVARAPARFAMGNAEPKNSRTELNRIAAELKDAMGPYSLISPRVFLEIGYRDLADDWHYVGYDVMPDYDHMGAGEMARPLDFRLPEAYGLYSFAPYAIWRVTGQEIKANWEKYPTGEELMKEEQKAAAARRNT